MIRYLKKLLGITQWYSVTKQPKYDEHYLMYWRSGNYSVVYFWAISWYDLTATNKNGDCITHWRKLPKEPKMLILDKEVEFCKGDSCYYYERYQDDEIKQYANTYGLKCGNREAIVHAIATPSGGSCPKWMDKKEGEILDKVW